MTFEFKITEQLSKLAEHALAHSMWQRRIYTGGEWGPEEDLKEPGLLLVKDQGVYLMSCFVAKHAPEAARLTKADGLPVVVYAEGHDPTKEDTGGGGYDDIGGDDFGEDLEGLPKMIQARVKRWGLTGRVFITLVGERMTYRISP